MSTLDQVLTGRVAALIEKAEVVRGTHRSNQSSFGSPTLSFSAYHEWRSQSLQLVNQLNAGGAYERSFEEETRNGPYLRCLDAGLGVLRAVHEDLSHGYLFALRSLVAAEVFSDFLDAAEHLLEQGYKDPAAMLGGAVLEDGLRRIAVAKDVTLVSGDVLQSLADKLKQAGVISPLARKQLSFLIGIRDSADHARFDEYTEDQVGELLRGVSGLLAHHLG